MKLERFPRFRPEPIRQSVDPPLHLVAANNGVQVSKRELTLVDRSNSSIRLTLWGKQAEAYEDDGSYPVIAFKGVKIGEFQGEALFYFGSPTKVDPCPLYRTFFVHD